MSNINPNPLTSNPIYHRFNPNFKRYLIDIFITQEIYSKADINTRYELMKNALASFKQQSIIKYGSRKNWELAVAKKHGCKSIWEYTKLLINQRGFENPVEYLQYLAEEKGFETYSKRLDNYLIKKHGSMKKFREYIAKNKGFEKYNDYQTSKCIKKGFKNRTQYEYYLQSKKYGSPKEAREILAKKAGFETYSKRRIYWKNLQKNRENITTQINGNLMENVSLPAM